jgi:predicted O-methyltransferase YrrM
MKTRSYDRSDAKLERIRRVRRNLAQAGPPRMRRPGDFEKVAVPTRDCDLLRDLLIDERAETVVEVGLAYASSALAIGEALMTVGAENSRHLIIDPFQESAFANVGLELLEDAGLMEIAQLSLEPSCLALPRFLAKGQTADAAFVDGSHRFHEVFLDLYFIRKIVQPGGLVVVDDYCWPSVQTAVRYFEVNMGWRSIASAFEAGTTDETTKMPRARALRLPDPAFEPAFEAFKSF